LKVALTPLDFLERARRLYGPLEAVVDGDRRIDYSTFAARAHRLAHLLTGELGVRAGDRVAYLCGNTLELLEAYYGVLLAGAVLTPLNIRLSKAELEQIVADCSASVLVLHPTLAGLAPEVATTLVIGDDYEAGLARQPATLVDVGGLDIDEDEVCELFYTSGSTGEPKGAMLSHRALATHALDAALTMGVGHRDVVLHTIPLFHVNGWGTPHWVTALGGRHVMLDRFDAGEVLRLIETERVTRLHLVPTMASMLLVHPAIGSRDLGSLVQATVGGAPAGPELLAELEGAFGCEVVSGYGLTEASPQLTKALTLRSHDGLPADEQRRRRATTGLPNVGVDLRVLDADDHEVPADGMTAGEICVRSNHVMIGYWKRPAETAEALRGGWLRTGDIATVDGEGYVTIVDRKSDIIVSGGENVSSVQIEHALCAHPAVLEAAVVGVPDERWGEVPRAFVALRPGLGGAGAAPTADDLRHWVATRLAKFKVPKRIDIVAELPKGGTGKVQKAALRTWEDA
jgi:fatty-acyl-CoA synthase